MRVLMILPALTEAKSPFWRPIKYSLFPPLGLATLAAYLPADAEVKIVDEHVEDDVPTDRPPDPPPDLVVIQAYITSARRAYALCDYFRSYGCLVALGGLHPTSLPEESAPHADVLFLGPGEQTFPVFLDDLRSGNAKSVYDSRAYARTLVRIPPVRRDLIHRERYFVPNSIVVTRGCPHHCTFCYKDAFFAGGRSFYTQSVDEALAEIERLPGRHLYFLDDHLLGDVRFGRALFDGMRGMGRLFQGAATVDSVLRGDLIERAAAAGLRSLFIGFESLGDESLRLAAKGHNRGRDYLAAIKRLDSLGIMVNGSFVFGLDGDGPDVFARTVDWAVTSGLTTATFHVATPYPGTAFFREIEGSERLLHRDWSQYDTRRAVFRPAQMTGVELEAGYRRAYRDFYRWSNIASAACRHESFEMCVKHFAYSAGWKRFEPLWNFIIKTRMLCGARPLLEGILSRAGRSANSSPVESQPRSVNGHTHGLSDSILVENGLTMPSIMGLPMQENSRTPRV
jgi:radical SAM superfamily enzyme YgiQ (UPF0313 family)